MVLAAPIAIGIPAAFLFLIYTLDLYASRTFRLVALCFGWGAVGAFGLAYVINSYVGSPLLARWFADPYLGLTVGFAPVVEEITKALILIYIARQPEFTYFVDGAIYGFASGIGFSIAENFLYLSANPGGGIALALARAFSTCLMHGAAAGTVGAAVGRFRFHRGSGRVVAQVGGWGAAVLLHALFNGTVYTGSLGGAGALLIPVAIGVAGVGILVVFVFLGLQEERRWLAETLDRKVGVTAAEVRAAQALGDLEELLQPIAAQFPRKAREVEQLVLLQAQIGIKRKVLQRTEDPRLRERLERSIDEMREEMERLRKGVGLYVMSYLRAVFPEGAMDIWSRMEQLIPAAVSADAGGWVRTFASPVGGTPSGRDIFASIQKQERAENHRDTESTEESPRR
ncbi:MAG TPA: PrsW family intramembrane metalloprotease [Thermoflexia bacterium]|nr:PrsW family intramembrane metalloprotease [Thermoflexia bacterium]